MASSVSPFARSSALWPLERPGREVGLEAGYANTADSGVMGGAGGQLQPVARVQIERLSGRRESEPDRAAISG